MNTSTTGIFPSTFLPDSGCKNASVGCIYGSNSLYDCIIGRGLYTLTNIHQNVFLPVVKMPCTLEEPLNFPKRRIFEEEKLF